MPPLRQHCPHHPSYRGLLAAAEQELVVVRPQGVGEVVRAAVMNPVAPPLRRRCQQRNNWGLVAAVVLEQGHREIVVGEVRAVVMPPLHREHHSNIRIPPKLRTIMMLVKRWGYVTREMLIALAIRASYGKMVPLGLPSGQRARQKPS